MSPLCFIVGEGDGETVGEEEEKENSGRLGNDDGDGNDNAAKQYV